MGQAHAKIIVEFNQEQAMNIWDQAFEELATQTAASHDAGVARNPIAAQIDDSDEEYCTACGGDGCCQDCGGSGEDQDDDEEECDCCEGSGACPTCDGSGSGA